MKAVNLLNVLFITALMPLYAQQSYQTDVMDKLVKTLRVSLADDPLSDPYIPLDGDTPIEISFDLLQDRYLNLAYTIIHCNADWTQSALSPIEYMSGFQGLPFDDFTNSMATTTQYTHYRLFLPNEDVQLKVSGNYVVKVYDENRPNRILFTACFSVYEPLVSVSATINGNTMIDTNQSHQQLSFVVDYTKFPITYPQSDLKIWVYQNNRRDNAVSNLQPTSITGSRAVYDYNRDLIFEAGNEYRRMEFLSNRYNGMHVDRISFHNPYYHVDLMTDLVRRNMTYQYDQDQDGHYLINCSSCNDPDTEADYYIVHFTLRTSLLRDGSLYLLGNIYNNVLDEKSKVGYNTETGQYEKSVQLKQGHYNYQYVFVPDGTTHGTTAMTEGNYYQAENEYSIFVYHRPMNTRYDRLIGLQRVNNRMPYFR